MDEKQELMLSLKTMLPMLFLLATLCEWQATQGSTVPAIKKLAFEHPDFISIDCGAPEDYDDNELRISVKADKEYIDTGENKNISKEYNCQGTGQENLRSFPNGTRNCYTLNPRAGRNNKYLIRSSFMYGNYDNKNKIPRFDIYLANDKWTTVDYQDPSKYLYLEIIYVPSSDYVDVCLHDIGSGTPFISALELRKLYDDSIIYDTGTGWLFVEARRHMCTPTSTSLRYPDDIYDRIWNSGTEYIVNLGWRFHKSLISYKIKSNAYNLPIKVLSCAATSENSTTPLELSYSILNATAEYIIYLHFAEIQYIEEGQKRMLKIYLNSVLDGTVELDYLQTFAYIITKPALREENNISISNADNSSLPPFLNALEVFQLVAIKGLSSAPDDVDAVKGIKKKYNLAIESWQGDPCTPKEFLWDGLNCSYNDPIRVVSV